VIDTILQRFALFTVLGTYKEKDQCMTADHVEVYILVNSTMSTKVVVNDFTDPNLVLDQNHFTAQVNTLYTNTIVTRANQVWARGLANGSSWLLFSRIFCSWMCENSLSPENREGRCRTR